MVAGRIAGSGGITVCRVGRCLVRLAGKRVGVMFAHAEGQDSCAHSIALVCDTVKSAAFFQVYDRAGGSGTACKTKNNGPLETILKQVISCAEDRLHGSTSQKSLSMCLRHIVRNRNISLRFTNKLLLLKCCISMICCARDDNRNFWNRQHSGCAELNLARDRIFHLTSLN